MTTSTRTAPGLPRTDPECVAAVRAGDPLAFDAIHDRYHGRLFAVCLQMLRDRTDAEDALQQTFMNAYRSMTANENEIQLGPWLKKIARNECLTRIRSRRELPAAEWEEITHSLANHAEHREELSELLRDIERLPDQQAAALTMSTLSGLSHAEIGKFLDCDANKVKSLAFRAQRSLLASRDARERDCDEVRELLDELNGGALRRIEIRDHLRDCPGCRDYRENRDRPTAVAA